MNAYEFSLAWRWTQPTHNVLPPEIMAQIKPLEYLPAPPGWTDRPPSVDRSHYLDFLHATADVNTEAGTKWLRSLSVPPGESVIVRWGCDSLAVETTWEVFTRFWDDFCYPGSDDVQIFTRNHEWLLLYRHFEEFEWGHRIV